MFKVYFVSILFLLEKLENCIISINAIEYAAPLSIVSRHLSEDDYFFPPIDSS